MVKPQWWLNREEDIEKINAFPEWEDSFDQCPELVECSSCGNFFPEEEICKTCNQVKSLLSKIISSYELQLQMTDIRIMNRRWLQRT